ncbi:ribonuclease T2 [Pseudohyphozyma bogoriensis]|nr:ribonuclease T2 [Pseudohyphozyma bogoriensis]
MLSLLLLPTMAAAAAVSIDPRWTLNPVPSTVANLTACSSIPAVYSCENTTDIVNTCCSPSPGGLLLATQFWDTYTGLEDVGQFLPEDSWTIHGLWPDYCDGSYPSYCDPSRMYGPPLTNGTYTTFPSNAIQTQKGSVSDILKKFGRYDLLDYMNGFWINQGGSNDDFWAHEFSKHATCTSTFDVACYPDYQDGMEVVDFLLAAIRAFKNYPSFRILAAAGIVPSNTTTYSLSDIQAAFKNQIGALPYFGCSGPNHTVFDEIWINAVVLGTPQYGQFKAVDTPAPSTCSNATGALHYYERTPSSVVSKYES